MPDTVGSSKKGRDRESSEAQRLRRGSGGNGAMLIISHRRDNEGGNSALIPFSLRGSLVIPISASHPPCNQSSFTASKGVLFRGDGFSCGFLCVCFLLLPFVMSRGSSHVGPQDITWNGRSDGGVKKRLSSHAKSHRLNKLIGIFLESHG